MTTSNVLILPGWQNSDSKHWQSRWQQLHGYSRVEQHDWMRPLRGDWTARLEDVLLGCEGPAVLVAHSLGCMLTAAWAAHSRQLQRVQAAFLVAPPDVEREDIRQMLPGWSAAVWQALPFKTVVLGSSNDPFCSLARAVGFARVWGADFVDLGAQGHVNSDSGLGDWPQGHQHLRQLMGLAAPAPAPISAPSSASTTAPAHTPATPPLGR